MSDSYLYSAILCIIFFLMMQAVVRTSLLIGTAEVAAKKVGLGLPSGISKVFLLGILFALVAFIIVCYGLATRVSYTSLLLLVPIAVINKSILKDSYAKMISQEDSVAVTKSIVANAFFGFITIIICLLASIAFLHLT